MAERPMTEGYIVNLCRAAFSALRNGQASYGAIEDLTGAFWEPFRLRPWRIDPLIEKVRRAGFEAGASFTYAGFSDGRFRATATFEEGAVPRKLLSRETVTYKLNRRMASSMRRSLNLGEASGYWLKYVDYSLDELAAHLESQFVDRMCWESFSSIHIDHKRPLSSFKITGTDCPEFKKAWALSNLQPLWAIDNIRKGAKWDGGDG